MTQGSDASLPNATVTFGIGSRNLGPSVSTETENKTRISEDVQNEG